MCSAPRRVRLRDEVVRREHLPRALHALRGGTSSLPFCALSQHSLKPIWKGLGRWRATSA
jgi:hypothetical protein